MSTVGLGTMPELGEDAPLPGHFRRWLKAEHNKPHALFTCLHRPHVHTDPAAALAQRLIYDQQISHLRAAMQRYLAGETIPGHVRSCYPFVRVHADTVARSALASVDTSQQKAGHSFVSSNGWDALGATWFGFTTLWVNRQGLRYETIGPKPTYTGRDLTKVCEVLDLN